MTVLTVKSLSILVCVLFLKVILKEARDLPSIQRFSFLFLFLRTGSHSVAQTFLKFTM